jgi:hypothetical protein
VKEKDKGENRGRQKEKERNNRSKKENNKERERKQKARQIKKEKGQNVNNRKVQIFAPKQTGKKLTSFWQLSVLYVALQQQVDFRQHVGQRRRQNDAAAEAGDGRHEQLTPVRRFLRRFVVIFDAATLDDDRQDAEKDGEDAENEH